MLMDLYVAAGRASSWRLNERHYGALQGLNKAETAAKFGDEAGADLAPLPTTSRRGSARALRIRAGAGNDPRYKTF